MLLQNKKVSSDNLQLNDIKHSIKILVKLVKIV